MKLLCKFRKLICSCDKLYLAKNWSSGWAWVGGQIMTSWNIYLNFAWFRYFWLQTLFLLNKNVIIMQIKQHTWYAAVSTFHLRPFSFQSEDVHFLDHWSVILTIHCYDVISEPISNFFHCNVNESSFPEIPNLCL